MAKKKTAAPRLNVAIEEEPEVEAALAEEQAAVEMEEPAAEPLLTDAPTVLGIIAKKANDEAAWLEKKFPEGGGGPAGDRLRDLISFLRAQSASEG